MVAEVIDIVSFKSGVFIKQREGFKSFQPVEINKQWILTDPGILDLLSAADRKLGELNAFAQLIPNVDFFISMHVIKEAVKSNRIEGTQTSIEEALMEREEVDPEKRDDWEEVQNYIKAMNHSIEWLQELPLSNRLLRQAHGILLQGVRGNQRQPGEFRRSQNWIGGLNLRDAIFIPPVHTEVPALMADLEKFLHNDKIKVPPLLRIAIAHYQFETIHPFLDGNGRLGRLLITLYMVSTGVLGKPALYLSDFFERHKGLYYDRLMRVRTHHEMLAWVSFFLTGLSETADNAIQTFKNILKLKEECETLLLDMDKRKIKPAKKLLTELYRNPVIHNTAQVEKLLGVSTPTAISYLDTFSQLGILTEITGGERFRIYSFEKYLQLFRAERPPLQVP